MRRVQHPIQPNQNGRKLERFHSIWFTHLIKCIILNVVHWFLLAIHKEIHTHTCFIDIAISQVRLKHSTALVDRLTHRILRLIEDFTKMLLNSLYGQRIVINSFFMVFRFLSIANHFFYYHILIEFKTELLHLAFYWGNDCIINLRKRRRKKTFEKQRILVLSIDLIDIILVTIFSRFM